MIIVTGCPRSGTSLTMDLMRVALGEDNIVGNKFPQEERINRIMRKRDNESDAEYEARIYAWKKQNEDWEQDLKESKDMNPNGFWECRFTVQGVTDPPSHISRSEYLQNLLDNGQSKVCKIVSQGIAKSDPKYIDKIVFLLRHPREVAKSQERLKRNYPAKFKPKDDKLIVHSPIMFNRVTYLFAKWKINNPDIPMLTVMHRDLISHPSNQVDKIKSFIGIEGDWEKAKDVITPKLKRSEPEPIDSPLWEDAEKIWNLSIAEDWQGVVDYFDKTKKERATQKEGKSWYCPRWGGVVNEAMCESCRNNPVVRNNFRKTSEKRGIDWKNEPCLYETAYGGDNVVKISIEESIKYNFWEHNV